MTGHVRKHKSQSGKISYRVVFPLGWKPGPDGKLHYRYKWISGFRTKKEAEAELSSLLTQRNSGSYVEPAKETLGRFLDRWLETERPSLAGKTFERYQGIVERNIKPSLGNVALSQLDSLTIQEFYTRLLTAGHALGTPEKPRGLSPQSVVHIHRLLSKALRYAVELKLLQRNPAGAGSVEPPRPVRQEMRALTEPESAWLMHASAGTRLYLPVLLALTTGLRRGEIFGLRWSDLDLTRGELTVNQSLEQTKDGGLRFKPPKTKAGRRPVSLPRIAVEALCSHQDEQNRVREMYGDSYQDSSLVLPWPDGSPWSPDAFTSAFSDFARKIGLKVRFHDLRHSHASQLLRGGASIKLIQQRLGHSTPAITLAVYSHITPADDQRAAEGLNAKLTAELERLSSKPLN
jgi:integrase